MANIKLETPGLMVHNKLKSMTTNYGVMMTGVAAELIGQMQAERSLPKIDKTENHREQILNQVLTTNHMMTEPTQSCGQASNDVCELLLGKAEMKEFHHDNYNELSKDGTNLKEAFEMASLSSKNLLIRFELDRANYPDVLVKIKRKNFNPEMSTRNIIYLLENRLYFLDKNGNLFDLRQSEQQCIQQFKAIGKQSPYSLCDPYILEKPDKPEELAIRDIANFFNTQKDRFDCWLGSHSFTVYLPEALDKKSQQYYHYQAYFGSHTLQDWFASDKDICLSQIGIEKYIGKLISLGKTTDITERSDIYGELFSKRGREKLFCAHLNQKRQQLRVKFKITEVHPEVALKNMQDLQEFINTYPGDDASDKVENYRNRTKISMTRHLENLLEIKTELNPSSFWHKGNKMALEEIDKSLDCNLLIG